MDVIFEVQRGRSFSIEVGFFDTVLEIKEKVQKYQAIPISKQTLILNGQILQDDDDVWKVEILHNTRIQLLVAADHSSDNNNKPVMEQETNNNKIQLNVKMGSSSSKVHVPLEMDVNDTVVKLKERIHEMEGTVPVNRLILHANSTGSNNSNELHDHQLLRDCDISDNTEIEVSFRPAPPPTTASTVVQQQVAAAGGGGAGGGGGGGGGGSKNKLKLMVLPKSGTKKIPVEVNASDNVGELRKELHRLNQRLQFHLPQEGYFFIYKQNVMDDDKSFRWHHVAQGDTIEIFNGSVTGGS